MPENALAAQSYARIFGQAPASAARGAPSAPQHSALSRPASCSAATVGAPAPAFTLRSSLRAALSWLPPSQRCAFRRPRSPRPSTLDCAGRVGAGPVCGDHAHAGDGGQPPPIRLPYVLSSTDFFFSPIGSLVGLLLSCRRNAIISRRAYHIRPASASTSAAPTCILESPQQ